MVSLRINERPIDPAGSILHICIYIYTYLHMCILSKWDALMHSLQQIGHENSIGFF